MSLKTLLMPAITQRRFARSTLLAKRAKAEKARQAARRPHEVHYFHQIDDPYSHLLAQALPRPWAALGTAEYVLMSGLGKQVDRAG